jgi:hypothetical protein
MRHPLILTVLSVAVLASPLANAQQPAAASVPAIAGLGQI